MNVASPPKRTQPNVEDQEIRSMLRGLSEQIAGDQVAVLMQIKDITPAEIASLKQGKPSHKHHDMVQLTSELRDLHKLDQALEDVLEVVDDPMKPRAIQQLANWSQEFRYLRDFPEIRDTLENDAVQKELARMQTELPHADKARRTHGRSAGRG